MSYKKFTPQPDGSILLKVWRMGSNLHGMFTSNPEFTTELLGSDTEGDIYRVTGYDRTKMEQFLWRTASHVEILDNLNQVVKNRLKETAMSKELNDIRKLAGLKQLVESKEVAVEEDLPLEEEDEIEEEVDHTRYGNEEDTTSYHLRAFDNKGRASLPNRYVQSRYGDNPLKNAKQIAKEDVSDLEAELEQFIAESKKTEECDDADEDILVTAKDQLDEIDLDEDQIDEVSNDLLDRYMKKASDARDDHLGAHSYYKSTGDDDDKAAKERHLATKRLKGINTARYKKHKNNNPE